MNKNLDIANLLEYNKNKKINLDILFTGALVCTNTQNLTFDVDLYQYTYLAIYAQGLNSENEWIVGRTSYICTANKINGERLNFSLNPNNYFSVCFGLIDSNTLLIDARATKAGFKSIRVSQIWGLK